MPKEVGIEIVTSLVVNPEGKFFYNLVTIAVDELELKVTTSLPAKAIKEQADKMRELEVEGYKEKIKHVEVAKKKLDEKYIT